MKQRYQSLYLHEKEALAANFEAMATRLNEGEFTEAQLRMIKLKQDEIWRIVERRAVSRG